MKIICLTSNEYLNILSGFAYLFNKHYPNQEVTVVRYENRPPKLPDNFKNYAIGQQANYSWSGGLKRYLVDIDDEFVLLMLEDYYLDSLVDVEQIDLIYNIMRNNDKIFKFDLTDDRMKVKYEHYRDSVIVIDEFKGNVNPDKLDLLIQTIIQSDVNAPYLASLQAAIWRKDFLLSILNTKDDPWQFEKNKRTKLYLQNNKGVILGCVNPPMSYINAVGGEGHKPGEYDLKKLPESMIEELKANHVWMPK